MGPRAICGNIARHEWDVENIPTSGAFTHHEWGYFQHPTSAVQIFPHIARGPMHYLVYNMGRASHCVEEGEEGEWYDVVPSTENNKDNFRKEKNNSARYVGITFIET
jgi:hypothetical protein